MKRVWKPMKRVWKTVLELKPLQSARLPVDAEILHVREQQEKLCMWYRCDPDARMANRNIAICGTGHEAPEGRYLGTGILQGGSLVLHVFEIE